ncbi:unnamed protein product [Vitrella brassicaformis CCMP3155]|uniref:beta-glucosidase n=1 Tax=Vitrella brassicaformis (strain CCMP3155) TaxID=1169540 RepID=A0A0G4G033_VITBC|nr:unnamed protein product [Vitrella brassicaformis CCMP3155]|eukprot:CEM21042.1 unnamed protein product [Vitrella brassicaformis CCMP3155]
MTLSALRVIAVSCLLLGCALAQCPSGDDSSVQGLLTQAISKAKADGVLGDKDFIWGTATAAYQVEGAWNEGGRVPSLWDNFAHEGKASNDTGDVAVDFYHKYPEDIQMMKQLNFTHFRYSISWPRVMNGLQRNEEGIQFYKDLTAELLKNNIEPVVTLFHWDLPDIYDWRNESLVEPFGQYADIMFEALPDVKYWLTLNEPWVFCKLGYQWGVYAPGVVSETDFLTCGHNALKAHAKAYSVWKTKYQASRPDTKVGITLNADWRAALDPTNPDDVALSSKEMDLVLGWFAEPVYGSGDYPQSLKEHFAADAPVFTEEEKASIKGSSDFFGLNFYTAIYVDSTKPYGQHETVHRNGELIGEETASEWLHIVPWGFSTMLKYIKNVWNPPSIIVTENGVSDGRASTDKETLVNDYGRVKFYQDYLTEMAKAMIEDDVPVTGYIAWSLLDNFEWSQGYAERFGLTHVDFDDPALPRTVKKSGEYFGSLIPNVTAQVEACSTGNDSTVATQGGDQQQWQDDWQQQDGGDNWEGGDQQWLR